MVAFPGLLCHRVIATEVALVIVAGDATEKTKQLLSFCFAKTKQQICIILSLSAVCDWISSKAFPWNPPAMYVQVSNVKKLLYTFHLVLSWG